MIGHVIMDIGEAEMRSAVQYYLNSDLFFSKHKVTVSGVRQRGKRFVVEFDGQPEIRRVEKPVQPVAHEAGAGG